MRRYKTTESVGIESFTVKLAEPRLVDYENVDVVCIILVGQGGRKEGGGANCHESVFILGIPPNTPPERTCLEIDRKLIVVIPLMHVSPQQQSRRRSEDIKDQTQEFLVNLTVFRSQAFCQ
jgi:hypothetical protein